MAQWLQLENLAKKNSDIQQRISAIYSRRVGLPVDIRAQCATWIESQPWLDMKTEYPDFPKKAEALYKGLLEQIKILQNQADQDLVKKLNLKDWMDTIQERFDGQYTDFVDVVTQCLRNEIMLIQSILTKDNPAMERKHGMPIPDMAQENPLIMEKVRSVREKLRNVEGAVKQLEGSQERMIVENQEIAVKLAQTEVQAQQNDSPNAATFQESIQKLTAKRTKLVQENFSARTDLKNRYLDIALELTELLRTLWQDIKSWKDEQRLAITALRKPKEGTVDMLDRMCDAAAELLLLMLQHLRKLLLIYQEQPYQDDQNASTMKLMMDQLEEEYLSTHLREIFIVEKNVSNQVIKCTTGKSLGFSMSARFLGGKSLGLALSPPKVSVRLYYEKDLPEVMKSSEKRTGICHIVNGTDKAVEMHRGTGRCLVLFNNMVLEKVRRMEKGRNDEFVTEHKNAFVFFTEVKVWDKSFPLKAMSLPMVITSQTSQECMAKGTLIWSAAFPKNKQNDKPEEEGLPFDCEDQVKWSRIADVINHLFEEHTGRGLTADHLKYLARIAFREKTDVDLDNTVIHKNKLLKEKLPRLDFQFWKWLWSCLNLLKDKIHKEWQEGLVYGFISKKDAEAMLKTMPVGTFLIRFSESNIEAAQRADICGYLTVAVVECHPETGTPHVFHIKECLTPKDLHEKGLGPILDAYQVDDFTKTGPEKPKKPLLRYLWQPHSDTCTKFMEVFGHYIKQKEENDDGYKRGKFRIEIYLTDTRPSRRTRTASDEWSISSATSPSSTFMPTSPWSEQNDDVPMSPMMTDSEEMQMLSPPAPLQVKAQPVATVQPMQPNKLQRTQSGSSATVPSYGAGQHHQVVQSFSSATATTATAVPPLIQQANAFVPGMSTASVHPSTSVQDATARQTLMDPQLASMSHLTPAQLTQFLQQHIPSDCGLTGAMMQPGADQGAVLMEQFLRQDGTASNPGSGDVLDSGSSIISNLPPIEEIMREVTLSPNISDEIVHQDEEGNVMLNDWQAN